MMNIAQEYAQFFQGLNPDVDLQEYEKFFDANSYFEDPFQKVVGLEKIVHIFNDMYAKFYRARFEVKEVLSEGNTCYVM